MPKISGMYSGVTYTVLEASGMDDVVADMVSQNQKDRICSIFMLPGALWRWIQGEDKEEILQLDATGLNVGDPAIGSYTPRNKKLLCYPYKFVTVDTTTEAKEYKIELFDSRTVSFRAYFLLTPNPEMVVCPINYNKSAASWKGGANFTENVKLTGFPQCAMSIDSYAAWLAQNSGSMYLAAAGAGVATVGGIMTGNVPAILGGVGTMGKMVADAARESSAGSTSRGNVCSNAIAVAGGLVIYVKVMGVKEETARMLDDYFDRFGYVCNRVKIPTRNNRPHWTYVKTKNCAIHGGVPAEYAKKICSIYDNGITWWNQVSAGGSTVGDYSQNNSPAS